MRNPPRACVFAETPVRARRRTTSRRRTPTRRRNRPRDASRDPSRRRRSFAVERDRTRRTKGTHQKRTHQRRPRHRRPRHLRPRHLVSSSRETSARRSSRNRRRARDADPRRRRRLDRTVPGRAPPRGVPSPLAPPRSRTRATSWTRCPPPARGVASRGPIGDRGARPRRRRARRVSPTREIYEPPPRRGTCARPPRASRGPRNGPRARGPRNGPRARATRSTRTRTPIFLADIFFRGRTVRDAARVRRDASSARGFVPRRMSTAAGTRGATIRAYAPAGSKSATSLSASSPNASPSRSNLDSNLDARPKSAAGAFGASASAAFAASYVPGPTFVTFVPFASFCDVNLDAVPNRVAPASSRRLARVTLTSNAGRSPGATSRPEASRRGSPRGEGTSTRARPVASPRPPRATPRG